MTGLSHGQHVMLRAGLRKLQFLEEQFTQIDARKHPKLLVVYEDTTATPYVTDFLYAEGFSDADVLRVDSERKQELSPRDWSRSVSTYSILTGTRSHASW